MGALTPPKSAGCVVVRAGFTGDHGVGKITLCREFANRLNLAGLMAIITPEIPGHIVAETGDPHSFRRTNNTVVPLVLQLSVLFEFESRRNDNGVPAFRFFVYGRYGSENIVCPTKSSRSRSYEAEDHLRIH